MLLPSAVGGAGHCRRLRRCLQGLGDGGGGGKRCATGFDCRCACLLGARRPGGQIGLPVIQPGALATLAVAIALLAAAGVVATQAGLIFAGAFQPYALILSVLLAFAFLARGVGDFRYVGFFKKVVGSRFARLDTWVFSPLCVLLALLIADAIVGAF